MTTIYILTILNINKSMLHVCTQYFTCIYMSIKGIILQLCDDDVVVLQNLKSQLD